MRPSLQRTLEPRLLLAAILPLAGCLVWEKGPHCYWMEDEPPYAYEPAWWVDSLEECYAMDSCSGGLGQSSGGCYKWADSADGEAYPWPSADTASVVDTAGAARVHVLGTYSWGPTTAEGWLLPGASLVIYEDVEGNLARCLLDDAGQLIAHNHDMMSEDGPGTTSEPVTSGCAVAEEYGYQVSCCLD